MTDYQHRPKPSPPVALHRRRVVPVIVHPVGWTFSGYNRALDGGRASASRALPAPAWSMPSSGDLVGAGVDLSGSVLYVTHQPCIRCARLIVSRGIRAVHYRDPDDKTDGLQTLLDAGVKAARWPTQQQVDREFFMRHGSSLGPRELEALGGHQNRIVRGMD